SGDPFDDSPATLAQHRTLTNWGVRADVSFVNNRHNLKAGGQFSQTRLNENFSLGITDELFNAICVDGLGTAQAGPGVRDPSACASLGLLPNPDFQPGLLPLDLTRGGSLFHFGANGNINELAGYIQDTIT